MKAFLLLFLFIVCISTNGVKAQLALVNTSLFLVGNESNKIEVFEVKRIKTKVDLLWQTDRNNSGGFEIQRKSSSKEWERVAFVFPQTEEVNGNKKLIYEYTDVNIEKGETFYRLRQIASNTSYIYSDIRAIAGIEIIRY